MKNCMTGAAALALFAGAAQAGGIERASNNYGLLFDSGNKIEFSARLVRPEVSGDYPAALGGGSTGNMARDFPVIGTAYKNQLTDNLDFGLFLNNAYGADSLYTQGFYQGLRAEWDSNQVAAILKYRFAERFSVYGGARYVESRADITLPDQLIRGGFQRGAAEAQAAVDGLTAAGVPANDPRLIAAQTQLAQLGAIAASPAGALQYDAVGDKTGDWGYVLGVAYEIPDIALRVSLTYESAITHKFDSAEVFPAFGINTTTQTEVEMPQSLALEVQTGIAPGTLLFGGVKWVEWSAWEVRTPGYESVTGTEITGFENDTYTWRLGIGRQFNENTSGFAQVTYEASNGDTVSRLSPTDGRLSLGLGGQWTDGENVQARFGIEYAALGDAEDASGVEFSGNSAFGVGGSFTYNF